MTDGWSLEEAVTPPKAEGGWTLAEAVTPPAEGQKKSGILANVGAGVNEFIAGVAGIPGNVAAHFIEPRMWNEATEEQRADLRQRNPKQSAVMDYLSRSATQARETIGTPGVKKAMGLVRNPLDLSGISANPDDVVATTPGEHLARVGGEGAAAMVIPGLGAEAILARTMKEGDAFGTLALDIIKGGGPVSNAIMGAAGGVGGEVAAEHAPDRLKPTARLLGGVLGGGLGAVAETGVRAAGNAAGTVVRDATRAVTEAPELRAARAIVARADDPAAFRQNAAEAAERPPLVAGSDPTTFQATGDLGVGALEREVAASPKGVAPFAERRTDQNTARLGEMEKLADPAADPGAVTDFAKSGLQNLTDYHAAQVAAATKRQEEQAATHLAALGRLADPAADASAVTDYVRARLQGLTADHSARVAAAAQGVADRLAQAGGGTFDNPASYGDALRAPLAAINQGARDAERTLWRAIDPDMSAPVGATPLKRFAAESTEALPATAKPPAGEEASILSAIGGLGEATDFGSMVALRSRLTDAIRDERRNGTPTVLRRLTMLLDNVDETLATTAGELASDPARRPAVVANLQREASTWEAAAANEQRAGIEAGRGVRAGDEGVAPGQAGGVPPAPGGQGQAREQPGIPAGDPGVPEAGGIAPDVAERYGAARAATRERKQTYESGPVGSVLAPGAQYGSFKTTASNVPKALFDSPERLDAFVAAAKGDPAALAPMQDYAAFSLRQAAVKDGMLSPERYQRWMDDHAYALRQFPELRERFGNVRSAQATLDEALRNQRQALADYQTGAVAKIVDGQDPVQVVGRALTDSAQFADLVNRVRPDPAATAGLKRAAIDYLMSRSITASREGVAPEINVPSLQRAFIQNRKTLAALFDAGELANIARVTVELQRASHSTAAAVESALGAQKQALTEYQTGALKPFLGDRNMNQAVETALKSPEKFKQLVAEAGKDENAFAGLKRAVVDFIMSKATGAAEAGTSELPQINAATLQKLYLQNRTTLQNSGLFTRDELDGLARVTADLQRANRSIVAVKIPGGSNTTQDTGSRMMTMLRQMMQHAGKAVGAAVGSTAGPAGTFAGIAAGAAADAVVAARMNSIDRAVVEMMLNPKMAALWLEKIPADAARESFSNAFARKMRALTANQVMQAIDEEGRR